jgi:hypothetical protein
MEKPKLRKTFRKILALLVCPFILTGCSEQANCKIPEKHVHKYIGTCDKGTVTTYVNSEDIKIPTSYQDGLYKTMLYERQEESFTITDEDEKFYIIKNNMLFKGEDNWDYLYNVMASKHDRIEYRYRYEDILEYAYRWIPSNQERKDYTGDVRVYHYRFCGHRIVYKDGKWVDERSPFVDDIREIIDEYPYFQLDCYTVVHKDYKVDKNKIKETKLEDVNDFIAPDLENRNLYTNKK